MAESHKKFVKGFCMGGETPFGSDPKGDYKLELQSPLEPHKEEEYRATPLQCEPEILVEEDATIVSVQEEDKVKNMYDEGFNFFIIHVLL